MDRQDGLFIALECTRVPGIVHHDGLEFAVSRQFSPQQEGEIVLECFKARGRLLLPRDVCAFRHLLPLQAHIRAQEKTCTRQAQQWEKEDWGETHALCLLPPLAPPTSQHPSYVTAHPNTYTWFGCACRVYSPVFGFSFSAFFGSTSTFTYAHPKITYIWFRITNGTFLLIFIIFLRCV